jgi:hypothetical protein
MIIVIIVNIVVIRFDAVVFFIFILGKLNKTTKKIFIPTKKFV